MDQGRRTFLRTFGLTVLGLPLASASAALTFQSVQKSPRKRLALAIDIQKLANPVLLATLVQACHKAHNVPQIPDPSKQVWWCKRTGLQETLGLEKKSPFPRSLRHLNTFVLCNHCKNPPCVRVCPTGATFQRPNGVVAMDAHRCIGCRYCMAACPYGARSFNYFDPRRFLENPNPRFPRRTKGVVEKCNLCEERLLEGKPPLCVSLSNGAIVFGDLEEPRSLLVATLAERPSFLRKPWLGTEPHVFYLL